MIPRTPTGPAVMDGTLVDAASISIGWTDPAVQWGLGVFETLAVRDGVPAHAELHRMRLEASAARVGAELPDAKDLDVAMRAVAAGVPGGHGWLKVMVSRSTRWVVVAGATDPAQEGRPVSVVILPWRRHHDDVLAGIKSLSYAAAMLGVEEARQRGADEGLFLNERGHVIEGCTSNVFIISGRTALTPALTDGARDGVTRARAIEALRTMKLSVRQSKLRVLALRHADEIFLTSSLQGVRAVVRLEGRNVSKGKPGAITTRLAEQLAAREVEDHA